MSAYQTISYIFKFKRECKKKRYCGKLLPAYMISGTAEFIELKKLREKLHEEILAEKRV